MIDGAEVLFAWAHLSDPQFACEKGDSGALRHLVLTRLHEDLAAAPTRGCPRLDAILVTGDIAFSGAAAEYVEAGRWLADIARTAGLSERNIYVVPGNHDTDGVAARERRVARLLQMVRTGEESLDDAIERERPLLAHPFRNYLAFAAGFAPACADLYWVHSFDTRAGLRVRLVGLNTALIGGQKDDRGALRLGTVQIVAALEGTCQPADDGRAGMSREGQVAATFANMKEDELVLVLSHHPFHGGWLADEMRADNWIRAGAHIHLSGHVANEDSECARAGAGTDFVRIAAGIANEGSAGAGGYNIAAIVGADDGSLSVRVWPRRWSDRNKAYRQDVDNLLGDTSYSQHRLRLHFKPVPLPAGSAGSSTPRPSILFPSTQQLSQASHMTTTPVNLPLPRSELVALERDAARILNTKADPAAIAPRVKALASVVPEETLRTEGQGLGTALAASSLSDYRRQAALMATGTWFRKLHTICAFATTEAVDDASYASFLRAAQHEDQKLSMGVTLSLNAVTKRARLPPDVVDRAAARALDDELAYVSDLDGQLYALLLSHDDIPMALSALERASTPTVETPAPIPRSPDRAVALLITAVVAERRAVADSLANAYSVTLDTEEIDGRYLDHFFWPGRTGEWEVYVAQPTEKGPHATQALLNAFVGRKKPRVVIMVGMCGGLPEHGAQEGDVIVARQVFNYLPRRERDGRSQWSPSAYRADPRLIDCVNLCASRGRFDSLRIHIKDYGSGESLIDDLASPLRKELLEFSGDLIGFEMEAHGLLHGNWELTRSIDFDVAVIKGVADFGDGKQRDGKEERQKTATINALAATLAVLSQY